MPSYASPDLHLYLDQPTAIFRARTNMPGTITYPVTALIFDTVTLGAFGDIQPDMTLALGTTSGADDLGRVRVQNFATSTTIPLGRVSPGVEDGTLYVQDNMHITVYSDWRVHANLPYQNSTTNIDYKDSDIPVLTYNSEPLPVANCGPGTADRINSVTGLITVTFPAAGVNQSFALADGATITTYLWDVKDGTITVGTSASAVITATFPAGFRWVGLTVTDSNDHVHTSRCPVLAVDPDADVTVQGWEVEGSQRLTIAGQTVAFRLYSDTPRTSTPDGCLVLFWDGWPTSATDRSHLRFLGWHQSDSFAIRAGKTGVVRDTILHCVDVAGRMATLPGFPQALERKTEPPHWSHMPTLTMRKCIDYLGRWHCTAWSLADVFLPEYLDDWPAMRLDSTGASLFEQINSRAKSMVPDHYLRCNRLGQLAIDADWMLQDVADRPALAATLTEDLWSELSVDYHRPPRVHVLRSSAVVVSTDWLVIGGEDTLPLAFSVAPGDTFGQGVSEAIEGEGLTQTQAALNVCEGHRYARLNARYGLFNIIKPDTDIWPLEPATLPRVQLNISALTAAQRGLDSTTLIGLVKELNVRYPTGKSGTALAATLGFERETFGLPAQTHSPEIPGAPDYETPPPPPATVPPEMGLVEGVEEVAGVGIDGFVYRTSDFQTPSGSGGPTWDEVDLGVGSVYSFVVDPFSPGYIAGAGTIDGWVVSDTDIYRVTDLFGTPVATSVLTFATATVEASYHWRSIQASFGAFFAEGVNPWLLCVSYYGSTSGHTGTWATYSTDGGVTWAAEVLVSAAYSALAYTRFSPIGVYASPKTPGLAYTAAHVPPVSESVGVSATDGYVTTDWGETWARLGGDALDSADEPLPAFDFVPGNSDPPAAPGSLTTEMGRAYTVGSTGTEVYNHSIFLAPPADAVRVVVQHYGVLVAQVTGGAGHSESYTWGLPAFVSSNGAVVGDYEVTFTRHVSQSQWPGNRDQLGDVGFGRSDFMAFNIAAHAVWGGGGQAQISVAHNVRVVEIELENGHIYQPAAGVGLIQPGYAQAGTVHLPWEGNSAELIALFGNYRFEELRQFRLYESTNGVIVDRSPATGGRSYGVNKGPFGIRAYDSDRNHLLLAGIGNDTSVDADDDFHGIFYSDDAGGTWSVVVTPIADSLAPAGRPAFEAAFSGTDPAVQFYWGKPEWMGYSDDAGVTVQDKTGNLSALSASGFVGIAGGVS